MKDIYVSAKTPTQIWFPIKAMDSKNNSLTFQCNKIQGSVFKVGKTTVRCLALDALGNEVRPSFTVIVGYNIVDIPDWLKQPTYYWIFGKISDSEYSQMIRFLSERHVMEIPHTDKISEYHKVPVWIKINSKMG